MFHLLSRFTLPSPLSLTTPPPATTNTTSNFPGLHLALKQCQSLSLTFSCPIPQSVSISHSPWCSLFILMLTLSVSLFLPSGPHSLQQRPNRK